MRSPVRSPPNKSRGRDHDRHSGTGSRGLPKKNGAGGKGVWGAEMDQVPVSCLDKKDPNYNSDEETEEVPPHFALSPPSTEPNKTDTTATPTTATTTGVDANTPASSTASVPSPNASV